MEDLIKEFGAKVDALKSEVVSKNDFNALKTELEALKTQGATAEQLKSLETMVKDLKDAQTSKAENEGNVLVKEIESNKETIKDIVSGKRGEVEIKALTSRASIDGNTNAYVLPTIGQLGVKRRALYDVLPKIQLSTSSNDNGVIKYHDWDESTTVRAAAARAEGIAFPESTATFVERTIPIEKIGDTLPVTEEFGEDAQLAAAELSRFLDVNVQTKVDNDIINGDGNTPNLKGLLASVPAFTAVASGIAAANIKDLVRKMRTSIVKTRGSKYSPDIVVMNSDTFDKYYLAKDENNNYLFDENGRIAGMDVVEDNNMPDNTLVVGDRRFATIYEKGGVVLSEGQINAQFTSDTKTIKARKRMAMLIRNVDATGFAKSTNISADLVTLAT
jgi:HK97 family phage major capsid protein